MTIYLLKGVNVFLCFKPKPFPPPPSSLQQPKNHNINNLRCCYKCHIFFVHFFAGRLYELHHNVHGKSRVHKEPLLKSKDGRSTELLDATWKVSLDFHCSNKNCCVRLFFLTKYVKFLLLTAYRLCTAVVHLQQQLFLKGTNCLLSILSGIF